MSISMSMSTFIYKMYVYLHQYVHLSPVYLSIYGLVLFAVSGIHWGLGMYFLPIRGITLIIRYCVLNGKNK